MKNDIDFLDSVCFLELLYFGPDTPRCYASRDINNKVVSRGCFTNYVDPATLRTDRGFGRHQSKTGDRIGKVAQEDQLTNISARCDKRKEGDWDTEKITTCVCAGKYSDYCDILGGPTRPPTTTPMTTTDKATRSTTRNRSTTHSSSKTTECPPDYEPKATKGTGGRLLKFTSLTAMGLIVSLAAGKFLLQ